MPGFVDARDCLMDLVSMRYVACDVMRLPDERGDGIQVAAGSNRQSRAHGEIDGRTIAATQVPCDDLTNGAQPTCDQIDAALTKRPSRGAGARLRTVKLANEPYSLAVSDIRRATGIPKFIEQHACMGLAMQFGGIVIHDPADVARPLDAQCPVEATESLILRPVGVAVSRDEMDEPRALRTSHHPLHELE